MMQVTSNEVQIATDIMEKGSSILQALKVVSKYCRVMNKEELNISNATSLLHRLKYSILNFSKANRVSITLNA